MANCRSSNSLLLPSRDLFLPSPSDRHNRSNFQRELLPPKTGGNFLRRGLLSAYSEDRWAAAGDMGELSAGLDQGILCCRDLRCQRAGGAGESVVPTGLL